MVVQIHLHVIVQLSQIVVLAQLHEFLLLDHPQLCRRSLIYGLFVPALNYVSELWSDFEKVDGRPNLARSDVRCSSDLWTNIEEVNSLPDFLSDAGLRSPIDSWGDFEIFFELFTFLLCSGSPCNMISHGTVGS